MKNAPRIEAPRWEAVRMSAMGKTPPAWLSEWLERNDVDVDHLGPDAAPGTWVLRGEDGAITYLSDKAFRRTYTYVPSRTPAYSILVHVRDPRLEPKAGDRLQVGTRVRRVLASLGARHLVPDSLTYRVEAPIVRSNGKCTVTSWTRWAKSATVLES